MNKVHVNEILPKKVERITTGSELLLIYEINKYAKIELGAEVSTEGIEVIDILKDCEHYSFVMSNGFTFGKTLTSEERAQLKEYDNNIYFSKTIEGVELKVKTPELWVYERDFAIRSNNFMHNAYVSHAYVSLVAYMLVMSYKEGIHPTLLIDHANHTEREFEYVDLLILKDWGNKLLSNLIEIKFADKGYQPEWQAFLTVNNQRGFMCREYSRIEKAQYLKSNFKIGDVVLLYKRTLNAKGKTLGTLINCYPAVIRGYKNGVITLKYYPIPQTLTTHSLELSNMVDMADDEDSSIYGDDDYDKFIESELTVDLNDIGVDRCTYIETTFFIKPIDSDGSYQYFKTEDGYRREWLSTLDTIYAVFEDRGVTYAKERFLKLYFTSKNRIPVYEQYRNQDF